MKKKFNFPLELPDSGERIKGYQITLIVILIMLAIVFITGFLGREKFEREKLDLDKVPKMVLAFYYAWYGNPNVTGKWIHWNHWIMNVETGEIIGRHDPNFIVSGRRDIGAAHYPLLGPYDSSDERVILTHLKWAREVGIDGFIVSWWGIDSFSDKSLRKILDVADKSELNIKITIYYESVGLTKKPIDKVIEDFEYIIKNYGSRPSFLKLEGKPVIFVYAVSVKEPKFWRDVFSTLRRKGLKCIFIGDTFDENYAVYFEGIHTYNPLGVVRYFESLFRGSSYEDLSSSLAKTLYSRAYSIAERYGLLLFATILPGYDDRTIRVPGSYLDRYDGYTYNLTWSAALKINPHGILICTWNEWHEGTEIEPSIEYRWRYLELTKHWTKKFKEA